MRVLFYSIHILNIDEVSQIVTYFNVIYDYKYLFLNPLLTDLRCNTKMTKV